MTSSNRSRPATDRSAEPARRSETDSPAPRREEGQAPEQPVDRYRHLRQVDLVRRSPLLLLLRWLAELLARPGRLVAADASVVLAVPMATRFHDESDPARRRSGRPAGSMPPGAWHPLALALGVLVVAFVAGVLIAAVTAR